jgi:tetratricopeptide (TPR) repeat protein
LEIVSSVPKLPETPNNFYFVAPPNKTFIWNLFRLSRNSQKAIELDPACGEAYTALGEIEENYDRNLPAAEANLLRGITLRPNNPLAETSYGIYLAAMNRPDEAVAHIRRAVRLDPLSFFTNRILGSALYFDRQYDESLHYLKFAAELTPERADLTHDWMVLVYEKKGMFPQAVDARPLGYE